IDRLLTIGTLVKGDQLVRKKINKEQDGSNPPPPHHLLHRTAMVHNCTTKMIHISVRISGSTYSPEQGQIFLLEPVKLVYGLSVTVESKKKGRVVIYTSLWDVEKLATEDMKVTQMKEQRNKRKKK
ncbi:hypothetical protein PRIPAC_96030, partial [Pristionchus pacificus]|uniref:Uncharacterized protein n=1 Tax=Pristionchus pacificus TaxID=54126 RepID=A0A2A6BJG0_PRIPA